MESSVEYLVILTEEQDTLVVPPYRFPKGRLRLQIYMCRARNLTSETKSFDVWSSEYCDPVVYENRCSVSQKGAFLIGFYVLQNINQNERIGAGPVRFQRCLNKIVIDETKVADFAKSISTVDESFVIYVYAHHRLCRFGKKQRAKSVPTPNLYNILRRIEHP